MFGRFRKKNCGKQCRHRAETVPGCRSHSLADFAQDAEVLIVSNKDRKTLEMGLFSGASVRVLKNRPRDANMVVATGESRYIISKESAAKIKVC